jgi:hypothetical protein
MRHPTEGVLRRLLDEPAGVSEPDRAHVAGCPVCLTGLAAARQDAAAAGTALQPAGVGPVDLPAAWHRLSSALPAGGAAPSPAPARARRARAVLRRPVVAAVAFAVVLAGAGTAAANDWLPVFRTEQLQPISLDTADLVALPDLSAYGDVEVTGGEGPQQVPDAAAAAAQSGLDVPAVAALPRGVTGEPEYQVVGELGATFTFSADRAARAAAGSGEPAPPVPAGLDGSQVRLVAGPGVAAIWGQSAGVPALVVGRAVAPTAYSSSGVPFETMRDYLLSLPGLPDDVAAQLRSFAADGSTLPLPVPSDQVTTTPAEVDGVPATVLETRDQALAAVLWVSDGVVTVVAGSLGPDEVLAVAEDLD